KRRNRGAVIVLVPTANEASIDCRSPQPISAACADLAQHRCGAPIARAIRVVDGHFLSGVFNYCAAHNN
ncbi:MAG: hypothetical protein WCA43_10680, partial [Bradyrhizobium sp.]